MTPIYQIQSEILTYLNEWQEFIWGLDLHENFGKDKKFKARGGKFFNENRSEYASSVECLMSLKHDEHDGFPPDSYGYDFNQIPQWIKSGSIPKEIGEPLAEKSKWLDDNLGAYLGYRFCALKMFYPPEGYISWHTNWNVPSFNILFTYNPTGDGFWRHINPTGSESHKPNIGENQENVVTIPDKPGWSCKVGYYGRKEEHDRIVWHTAYTKEPRITLGYVIFEESIWKNTVEEIAGKELVWPLAPYEPEAVQTSFTK